MGTTTLYSPRDVGFSNEKHIIDRCQVALLRAISQEAGARLVVKGGMAMRVAFGSMRLTKEIDFDCAANMSANAVKGLLRRGMLVAAQVAGIREVAIDVTKDTETTIRVRMSGKTHDGIAVRFETEVSGRQEPAAEELQRRKVVPPPAYLLSPFELQTYSLSAMAAAKVKAVLADLRNVPRDVADLKVLIAYGADPVPLLAQESEERLRDLRRDVLGKLALITYEMAQTELFPYLPPAESAGMTKAQWEDDVLQISSTVDQWLGLALGRHAIAPEDSAVPAAPRARPRVRPS